MTIPDRAVRALLLVIALFLGVIALRPLVEPQVSVLAQPGRFDHVMLLATTFLYKGQQGLLVLDKRNANVWFIPRSTAAFGDPVFVIKLPFEKLDQAPQ